MDLVVDRLVELLADLALADHSRTFAVDQVNQVVQVDLQVPKLVAFRIHTT